MVLHMGGERLNMQRICKILCGRERAKSMSNLDRAGFMTTGAPSCLPFSSLLSKACLIGLIVFDHLNLCLS